MPLNQDMWPCWWKVEKQDLWVLVWLVVFGVWDPPCPICCMCQYWSSILCCIGQELRLLKGGFVNNNGIWNANNMNSLSYSKPWCAEKHSTTLSIAFTFKSWNRATALESKFWLYWCSCEGMMPSLKKIIDDYVRNLLLNECNIVIQMSSHVFQMSPFVCQISSCHYYRRNWITLTRTATLRNTGWVFRVATAFIVWRASSIQDPISTIVNQ